MRVVNRSGYDTRDLARFFYAACRAYRVDRPITFYVTTSPWTSKGCADVGERDCVTRGGRRLCRVSGERRVSIAIAAPSYSSRQEFTRRLARLCKHEIAHVEGFTHEVMTNEALLYSEGRTPGWARDLTVRYRGRAPRQMPLLVGGERDPSSARRRRRRS